MSHMTISWRLLAAAVVLSLSVTADRAWAQSKDKDAKGGVPREFLPPAGMCRVWMDGVPPQQQPAPTDCASAVRNKPSNARVIYGEDKSKGKKIDDLPIKSLRGTDKKGPPLIPPDLSQADPRAREAWEAKKISDEQLYGDRPASNSPASSYPGMVPSQQGSAGSYGGYVTPGGVVVPGAGPATNASNVRASTCWYSRQRPISPPRSSKSATPW